MNNHPGRRSSDEQPSWWDISWWTITLWVITWWTITLARHHLTNDHPGAITWWKTTMVRDHLMKSHPGKTTWWTTTLVRHHLMNNHPRQRLPNEQTPWQETTWWTTVLEKDHPMNNHLSERSPHEKQKTKQNNNKTGEWSPTLMNNQPSERLPNGQPPWQDITQWTMTTDRNHLMNDHPGKNSSNE